MDDHLANSPEGFLLVDHLVEAPMGAVPGRLVVRQQMDAVLFRQRGHAPGVLEVHRQRLLHHHVDPTGGARLDHLQVLSNAAEGGHRVRTDLLQHRLEVGVDEIHAQAMLPGEALGEIPVGLGDTDDLDVASVAHPQYPVRVAVGQPGHADPDRRCSFSRGGGAGGDRQESCRDQDEQRPRKVQRVESFHGLQSSPSSGPILSRATWPVRPRARTSQDARRIGLGGVLQTRILSRHPLASP